nr:O-antigen ligase family protein [Planctomycetota bacterium]
TLTLANTVAAWLLVVAAPLAGSAMLGVRAWRAEADTKPPVSKLALLCVLLAACAAAMVASGARGPAAALVVASALVATTWLQSWYRVLPLVAVAILAGVAAQLPQLADNISVRLGYWRAAVTLIGEAPLAGHGIAGFEHAAPALLRVGDEFSRFAHNLYLETAVAGGVFAGAAVLAMGGWLALRRPAQIRAEPELSTALDQWLVFIPALAFPYMLMFGTLASDNLAWWPGAPTMPPLWALLLGVMFGWIAQAARALPLAPAPAWQLAVGTAVLACALDFSAQDLGFAGTAVLVVCLAGARQPRCCQARFADLLAAALPVAAGVVLVLALGRGSQLRSIDRSVSLLDGFGQAAAKGDAEGVWGYVHDLALESGREAPTQDQLTQAVVQAVLLQAWAKADAACVAWPPSPIRRHQLAPRHPDPSARLGAVRAALDAMPERPDSWATLAQLMLMQRRFADAVTAAREAVRIYPAKLGYQLLLADALEAQARASSEPEPLTGEAAALRAEVKRLNPQAHARHRAP